MSAGEGGVRRTPGLVALLVALLFAAVFIGRGSVELGAQGAYYDEVNKAVAAFAWLGRPSRMFSQMHVLGIPTVVMAYKGAVKAQLYGPWMLATGRPFTIEGWRLLGLLFVPAGFLVFALTAGRRLPWWALAALGLLLLSDAHLLVSSRHDWGPVAVAAFLRLAFAGLWLSAELGGRPARARNTFVLGALVGFGTFEKLSSVVMVVPFLLVLLLGRGRRSLRHLAAGAAGGLLGGLPLLAANAVTLLRDGTLLSLHEVGGADVARSGDFTELAGGYLSLGQGATIRAQVFGDAPAPWWGWLEGALVLACALAVLPAVGCAARGHPARRTAATALIIWVGVAAALHVLPRATSAHHWVVGTPFHYLAFVLALVAVRPGPTWIRNTLMVLLSLLVAARIAPNADVQRAFAERRASRRWDPGLTAFARFAAERPSDHGVLAADWGIATQVFCFAQGRSGHVREAFRHHEGPGDLARELEVFGKRAVYVVALDPPSGVRPEATARLLEDVRALPGWRVVEPEPRVAELAALRVVKIVRAP